MLLLLAACASKPDDSASADDTAGDPGTPIGPDIAASPDHLDFGTVTVGTTSTLTIAIQDVGDEDLELYGMLVEQKEFPFTVSNTKGGVVAPGEALDLDVTYAPVEAITASSHVRIYSNDGETPVLLVAIYGEGG